jgi:hypothetical protein
VRASPSRAPYGTLTKQESQRTSLGGFAREVTRDAAFPRDAALAAALEYIRARLPHLRAVSRVGLSLVTQARSM